MKKILFLFAFVCFSFGIEAQTLLYDDPQDIILQDLISSKKLESRSDGCGCTIIAPPDPNNPAYKKDVPVGTDIIKWANANFKEGGCKILLAAVGDALGCDAFCASQMLTDWELHGQVFGGGLTFARLDSAFVKQPGKYIIVSYNTNGSASVETFVVRDECDANFTCTAELIVPDNKKFNLGKGVEHNFNTWLKKAGNDTIQYLSIFALGAKPGTGNGGIRKVGGKNLFQSSGAYLITGRLPSGCEVVDVIVVPASAALTTSTAQFATANVPKLRNTLLTQRSTLHVDNLSVKRGNYQIYNLAGQPVQSGVLDSELNISAVTTQGMYILVMEQDGNLFPYKFQVH